MEQLFLDLQFIGDLFDLLGGTSGVITGGLSRWYLKRTTRRWPVTAITIMKRAHKDGVVTLSYCYRVAGELYGGFCERKFHGSADAQRYLDRFDDGCRMYARYDPRRPERSWISLDRDESG